MAKLKPPYIENILTPFIIENDTATFRIPFTLSRSVHRTEVAGAAIIIKNAINNIEIVNSAVDLKSDLGVVFENSNNDVINGTVNFSINKSDIKNPQNWFINGYHYKIQIALIKPLLTSQNKKDIGFYSSVGIAKCMEKPIISFAGNVDENGRYITTPQYEYTVNCELREPSEKIATYKFDLIEKSGKIKFDSTSDVSYADEEIIFSTGWQTHNTANDIENISQDTCYLTKTLNFSKKYLLKYSMITINGYEDSSTVYFEPVDSINVSFKNYLQIGRAHV